MPHQLSFDLPVQVALGEGDFFVAPANAQAYAMVTQGHWPEGKLALIGPPGSGKSHLGRVWADRQSARIRAAAALDPEAPLPPAGARLVIEDVEHLAPAAEEYVFHLHNHLRATGGRLLLTADRAPSRWPIRLPDLASRMQATSIAMLDDPDDRLLAALLMKLFADRQLAAPPDLIDWLALRIERSHRAAAQAVAALDAAALSLGRNLAVRLARDVLDKTRPPAP